MLDSAMFVADLPVRRELDVVRADGSSAKVELFVRELGLNEFRAQMLLERDGSAEEKRAALAALIARSIVDRDGNPEMTVEQAGKLKPEIGGRLRDLIMGVNGLGEL